MGTAFIEEIKRFEPELKSSSWGVRWEVRSKIITCLLSTIGVVYLQTPILLLGIFIVLILINLSIGFTIKYMLSKLVMLVPFLLLMSIPILFSTGFPIEKEKLDFVSNLNLKALSAALLMMIMLLSQPLPHFINGLTNLHLPVSIVAILVLALHYTRLIYRIVITYQKALSSRLFKPSAKKNSLKVYSGVMAGLVLRSVDQSDKVYQAMVARGFKGSIPGVAPNPIKGMDIFTSSLFLIVITAFIIIEKWWFLL